MRFNCSPCRRIASVVVLLLGLAPLSASSAATRILENRNEGGGRTDVTVSATSSVLGGTGLQLDLTLSIDPVPLPPGYDFCGTDTVITTGVGSTVRWCYTIRNQTGTDLTRHDLQSDRYGTVLSAFPYTLVDGASAFLTQTESVTESIVESATWTAYNPGPVDVHVAADAARLQAESMTLELTVSVDPEPLPPGYDFCGSAKTVYAEPGQFVRWCYQVSSQAAIDFTRHDLDSPRLGVLLNDFPYTLVPSASAFLTQREEVPAGGAVESATWTVSNPGPVDVYSDTDSAAVTTTIFDDGFETR